MPAFNFKTHESDHDQQNITFNLKELASSYSFPNRIYQLECAPMQISQNESEEACKFEFVRVQRQIISTTEQGEDRVILILVDTST